MCNGNQGIVVDSVWTTHLTSAKHITNYQYTLDEHGPIVYSNTSKQPEGSPHKPIPVGVDLQEAEGRMAIDNGASDSKSPHSSKTPNTTPSDSWCMEGGAEKKKRVAANITIALETMTAELKSLKEEIVLLREEMSKLKSTAAPWAREPAFVDSMVDEKYAERLSERRQGK